MLFGGMFEEPKPQRKRVRYTERDKEPYFKAQGGKCNGCKRSVPIDLLEMDHKISFSKGGSEKPGNFQLLCGSCNKKKSNKSQSKFEKTLNQEKGRNKAAASKTTTSTKQVSTAKKKKPVKKKNVDPFADLFGF